MIHYRQHIPDFFSGFDSEEADCETLAEVLDQGFPKHCATYPGFIGWSLAHRPYSERNRSLEGKVEGGPHYYEDWLLMANYDNDGRRSWWVIGYLTGLTLAQVAELPQWEKPVDA